LKVIFSNERAVRLRGKINGAKKREKVVKERARNDVEGKACRLGKGNE
jgi:hypothetical protein